MKQRWKAWSKRFAAFKPREQALILLAALASILALADQAVLAPSLERSQRLRAEMDRLSPQLAGARSEAATLAARLAADPNQPLRERLAALDIRLKEQGRQLGSLTADLIPPERMATVLREVLATRLGLKLKRLQNLPAVPAFPELVQADAESPEAPKKPALYKHGLDLTVQGGYFEVLDYLQALEQLPWHFYFEGMDYRVEAYPQAQVTLHLYTLSATEDWIGV